ncbi:MAG: hypothetical protein J7M38_14920, partial [Armatimonadetes bacterium]|nr:hypothetical protein [Armatimonadota bacterium]
PIQDQLVVDLPRVSDDEDLVYMDYGGVPTTTVPDHGTARVGVNVKPRNVAATRAVLALPTGAATEVRARGELSRHRSGGLIFTLTCPAAGTVPFKLWLPDHAMKPALTLDGGALAVREEGGLVYARAPLSAGANSLALRWTPRITARNTDELLDFPFVADGKPNCNIVAAAEHRNSATRVQHFFREYYRWAVDNPADVRLPILTPDRDTGGRRVWIGVEKDLPDDLGLDLKGCLAAFGVQGDTVYAVAWDEDLLDDTVLALLETLDEAYPYWGHLAVRHYYFRDDLEGEVPALIEAGVAGGVLEGEESGDLPGVEDFPELIVWP